MIRNRIFLKAIAAFLILETFFSTVAPTISWALTSGPTAPEATSFEPVDTTDMVNLASGDLAYNIPLLEVPGPSGGYPLSLSYHAGIQPNEDASWVGLGWTLNPGAITRNVNGFADDYSNVENSTRYYWKGGETHNFEVGVTLGPLGAGGPSIGLSYSHDTYQGTGVGFSIGNSQILAGGLIRNGIEFGFNSQGEAYLNRDISLSMGAKSLNATGYVGIQTNFESTSVQANASIVSGLGPLNISIGTNRGGVSSTLSGASASIQNSKAGKVSVNSSGAYLPIPLGAVTLSLGYQYSRYWIDQIDRIKVNGALNYPTSNVSTEWLNSHAYDTYSLLELDSAINGNSDAEEQLGGSFPNYDNFFVHAQGVGGSIRPYYFQKNLVKRNDFEVRQDSDGDDYNYYKTIQYGLGSDGRRAEFRFVGDFSNRFEYAPEPVKRYPATGHDPESNPMTFSFSWADDPIKGETGLETYINNRLPGSRHIEYLTNTEIINQVRTAETGFIETASTGFNRANQPAQGIGAIIITNESGVKYHFSLPVMSSQEYSYSENLSSTTSFNEYKNLTPYAYTWYLTGVTGPDYVDRGATGNADGILNEFDWGYWVDFEYGKWTDQYYWRTPAQDYHVDIDGKFKTFSEGRKELYYLDAIRTKTHTALFVKDIRHDSKSTIYSLRDISNKNEIQNKESLTTFTKQGGFIPKQIVNTCNRDPYLQNNDSGEITYYSRPTSALRLKEIYLFQNNDLSDDLDKSNGVSYSQQYTYTWNVIENANMPLPYEQCDFTNLIFNHHLYQNILDVYDLQTVSGLALKPKALRVITLDTDYSLTPGTENSFDFTLAKTSTPSTHSSNYPRHGKLTLKKLYFNGKGGAQMIPPMLFGYELDSPAKGVSTISHPSGADAKTYSFENSNLGLSPGDIIKFNSTAYGFITKISGDVHTMRVITPEYPTTGSVIEWEQTKNPPYQKDAFDIWGLYKPDVSSQLLNTNETGARLVTPQSAKAQDVWSLRTIQSSLGGKIQIEYEPDSYKKPVLSISQPLRVEIVQPKAGSSRYQVVLFDNFDDLNLTIASGTQISYHFLFGDPFEIDLVTSEIKEFSSRTEAGLLNVAEVYKNVNNKWVIETDSDLSPYFQKRVNDPPTYYLASGPVFVAGNLSNLVAVENYGGGLRVKSVRSANLLSANMTAYDYSFDGHTSGVTAYEPGALDQGLYTFPNNDYYPANLVEKAKKQFNKVIYKNFSKLLSNARELPQPGVVYEFVTVSASTTHHIGGVEELPNQSTYQFEVFDEGMTGVVYEDYDDYEFNDPVFEPSSGFPVYDRIRSQKVTIKNFSLGVGSLKKVTLYELDGNEKRILKETINHYLEDGISSSIIPPNENDPEINNDHLEANIKYYESRLRDINGQGIVQETLSDARFVRQNYKYEVGFSELPVYHLLGVISKREEYPHVNLGQTTIDVKSGIVSTSNNLAFDFYTGQVTKSRSYDGHGNTFISEVTPAYRVYPDMGLASAGGRNMLTQEGASYTYKVDQDNQRIGIASGSVQTWSDQTPVIEPGETVAEGSAQTDIWRKRAAFIFIGDDAIPLRADGLHEINSTDPESHIFSAWTTNTTPAGWQKNGEITLYDVQSHALEAKDVNEKFAATKLSYDQTKVFATAANATYEEFAYSGAEETPDNLEFGGQVVYGNGGLTSTAHTGAQAVIADANNRAFTYSFVPKQRKYRISFWSSSSTPAVKYKFDVSGATQTAVTNQIGQAGDWYLLEADVEATGIHTQVEVWCQAVGATTFFDDFRVCPVDAAMSSYVYNSWGELSHILDNNNLYTEYRYDEMGRLKETFKETFNHGVVKTSEQVYHYANQE